MKLVLEWVKSSGGVSEMEKLAQKKSTLIYDLLDRSDFYQSIAHPDNRSTMNVTFNLPKNNQLERFLTVAEKEGLFALKGHAEVGGVRASLYNAMPLDGAIELANYMIDFEQRNG